jgi:hypothetical protein
MAKKPKEYHIDSFEKICNLVNEENVIRLARDFQLWLLSYQGFIDIFRKDHPEETRGLTNSQIAKGVFIWIDDGKNDLKGVELTSKETGEKTSIKF